MGNGSCGTNATTLTPFCEVPVRRSRAESLQGRQPLRRYPPLEALRALVSWAATLEPEDVRAGRRRSRKTILLIDVRKAHLHAEAVRTVYVALPPELQQKHPGQCWLLRRCLYGTKDAPARWEAHYTKHLEKMGFTKGLASSCCFSHPQRKVRCVVHGDDFTFVGEEADLDWAEKAMNEAFLCKVAGRVGPEARDLQHAQVLNRTISCTHDGYEYEADIRHAEVLVKEVGATDLSSVVTPGSKIRAEDLEGERAKPLDAERAGRFRALAARANYLALDRPDIAFSAKECCRRMSNPRCVDWDALVRIGRYLKGHSRAVYLFPWQEEQPLTAFVDSDYAGCVETRRSTSGGCMMVGSHLLKHWSSTQKRLALSSGEAELSGILKGSAEGLGMQSVLRDLGLDRSLSVRTDASAAIGICRRHGIGKVRHLAVGQLWAQERLRNGDFTLHKHPGDANQADLLTKHVPSELIQRHTLAAGLEFKTGRADGVPDAT